MQVQSIQTTNNCRKPCFKAYFVNDAAGNFRNLWITARVDKKLEQKIESFASKYKKHGLEIIGVNNRTGYVGTGHDRAPVPGTDYMLFNHYNGQTSEYFIASLATERLAFLLDNINKDEKLFRDDYTAKPYRYLTGREEPQGFGVK